LSIDNEDKREYYLAESTKNLWTARQIERLLLSNVKESVLAVARSEKLPSDPKEIIKDPNVLEFLGLKREATY
jgi:predicted nuclease of restriction endonuclease-like (RecB) superfamily